MFFTLGGRYQLMATLMRHRVRGIKLQTTFSGTDCASEALSRGCSGLVGSKDPSSEVVVQSVSTCDIGTVQSRVFGQAE